MSDLPKVEPGTYTMEQARADVFAAILRVVGADMELEIKAGVRLAREGKGTSDGQLPPDAIPLCLAATREVLAEMRRRAQPNPAQVTLPCGCVTCTCRTEERCLGCGGREAPACQASRLAGGPRHADPSAATEKGSQE